jgi:hypothetical protein
MAYSDIARMRDQHAARAASESGTPLVWDAMSQKLIRTAGWIVRFEAGLSPDAAFALNVRKYNLKPNR